MKNHRKYVVVIPLFALSLSLGCAGGGADSFKQGQAMMAQNNWEEAIVHVEKALSQEPENEEYKTALEDLRNKASADYENKAKITVNSMDFLNLPTLNIALRQIATALQYAENNETAQSYLDELSKKKEKLLQEVEKHYVAGTNAVEQKDWEKAQTHFKQIHKLALDYKDSQQLFLMVQENRAENLYQNAKTFMETEDWRQATGTFLSLLKDHPGYKDAEALLKTSQGNNSPQYYETQAKAAEASGNWDRVVMLYTKTLAFPNQSLTLQLRLKEAKKEAAFIHIRKCERALNQKLWFTAFQEFMTARNYQAIPPDSDLYKETIERLSQELFAQAERFEKDENFGNSLFVFQRLKEIRPQYPNLFFREQRATDEIQDRVRTLVGVFDFIPTKEAPDAGRNVANNLVTSLFSRATPDVKIVERASIGKILREIELGQSGILDTDTVKRVGKIAGIDIFVTGNILLWAVESDIQEGKKTVNLVISEKIIPNPAYKIWVENNPDRSPVYVDDDEDEDVDENVEKAPPLTILEPIHQLFSYKVAMHKKVAFVNYSYKIIDARTGEIIKTATVKKKKEVRDDYSEGLDLANVSFDPIDLPTDIELLEGVSAKIADELVTLVLAPLKDNPQKHYQQEILEEKRRNFEAGVERCTDAIFLEKIRNQVTEITTKAKKCIDRIIQNTS